MSDNKMDDVEQAVLRDVQRHECGCWTWTGPDICKVVRLLAEMMNNPLPAGRKMYRMPECTLGAECVNPEHVGTYGDYMLRVKTGKMNVAEHFTEDDLKFLSTLGILSKLVFTK